jgi:hypothetical protein
MGTKNVSTVKGNRGKDIEGFARLEHFHSLSPVEREAYLAECDPVLRLALREWLASKETGVGELGKVKAPPARPMRRELILLDFTPHDVISALDELREMVLAGKVTGLVFAASVRGEKHMFGASGSLRDNPAEALGAATKLQHECLEKM